MDVKRSSDQRNRGKIGPCKNIAAYRTVQLIDAEVKAALKAIRGLVDLSITPDALLLRTKRVDSLFWRPPC